MIAFTQKNFNQRFAWATGYNLPAKVLDMFTLRADLWYELRTLSGPMLVSPLGIELARLNGGFVEYCYCAKPYHNA